MRMKIIKPALLSLALLLASAATAQAGVGKGVNKNPYVDNYGGLCDYGNIVLSADHPYYDLNNGRALTQCILWSKGGLYSRAFWGQYYMMQHLSPSEATDAWKGMTE